MVIIMVIIMIIRVVIVVIIMLNNFCFHVNAQNSQFIGENVNPFFDASASAPYHVSLEFIALIPS